MPASTVTVLAGRPVSAPSYAPCIAEVLRRKLIVSPPHAILCRHAMPDSQSRYPRYRL